MNTASSRGPHRTSLLPCSALLFCRTARSAAPTLDARGRNAVRAHGVRLQEFHDVRWPVPHAARNYQIRKPDVFPAFVDAPARERVRLETKSARGFSLVHQLFDGIRRLDFAFRHGQ